MTEVGAKAKLVLMERKNWRPFIWKRVEDEDENMAILMEVVAACSWIEISMSFGVVATASSDPWALQSFNERRSSLVFSRSFYLSAWVTPNDGARQLYGRKTWAPPFIAWILQGQKHPNLALRSSVERSYSIERGHALLNSAPLNSFTGCSIFNKVFYRGGLKSESA